MSHFVILHNILIAIASYFIGSIPTAFLVARSKGIDIRKTGSGNPGATNVYRNVGKTEGIFTLLADTAKGFLPLFFLKHSMPGNDTALIVSAIMLVAGHTYTVWLGFRGGKGVATGMGVLLALAPLTILIGIGTFAAVFVITRYISAGSISGALAVAVFCWFDAKISFSIKIIMTILCILIILRHRSNILRLFAGTETKTKL